LGSGTRAPIASNSENREEFGRRFVRASLDFRLTTKAPSGAFPTCLLPRERPSPRNAQGGYPGDGPLGGGLPNTRPLGRWVA